MDDSLTTDFFNSLLIVLVIYKIDIKESPAYRSLTKALQITGKSTSLFVYDNSPVAQELAADQCWNSGYRHDHSNGGVSKAYNEGFKKAKEMDKKWLLLVDQDTSFPETAFESYFKGMLEFKRQIVVPILRDKIGIISPFKFYFGGGARPLEVKSSASLNLNDYFFTNSGLLINVNAFEVAGGYDENLPLDYSDIAFVCRLRAGINHFAVMEMFCEHQFSGSIHSEVSEQLSRFEKYVHASRHVVKNYSLSR